MRLLRLRGRNAWFLFQRSRCAIVGGLFGPLRGAGAAAENAAQFFRYVVIDGTGVSLFFRNAQLGKFLQQFVSFDFQLAGQHVNSNLVHK
jgi:hypothetical protein